MINTKHLYPFKRLATTAVLASLLVGSGCVRSSTFRTEMELLREEMREGDANLDQRLSSRIDAMETRMAALEQELMSLEEEFGARVERMEASLRVHTPVHFGFDEARLDSDQLPVLERIGAVLREYYPQALITVEGFTDPAGSATYNLQLGQRRADEVRAFLLAEGWMSEAQVRAVSYGEDTSRLVRPDAAGPGDRGRENRRVVIVIDHADAWTVTTLSAAEGTD
jgi:peptidoglycan-associated lipoprotein